MRIPNCLLKQFYNFNIWFMSILASVDCLFSFMLWFFWFGGMTRGFLLHTGHFGFYTVRLQILNNLVLSHWSLCWAEGQVGGVGWKVNLSFSPAETVEDCSIFVPLVSIWSRKGTVTKVFCYKVTPSLVVWLEGTGFSSIFFLIIIFGLCLLKVQDGGFWSAPFRHMVGINKRPKEPSSMSLGQDSSPCSIPIIGCRLQSRVF